MTVSELGSIGEFIASIVVLITLVYLTFQVRQNTQAMRMSQSQEFIRWNTEMVEPLANNRPVAELWIAGGENFDELDDTDQQRIVLFEWRAISAWNHYFNMRNQGLVPDHLWNELLYLFQTIGARQAMQEAWVQWRDAYDEDFRAFMDKYLNPKSHEQTRT